MERNSHWHPEIGTIKPLPKAKSYKPLPCAEIIMDDGTTYVVRVGELVSIQFIKNDQRVLVRRGRVMDIKIANVKKLSSAEDNVSNIILDCSEQFSNDITDIKLKDILQIRHFNHNFEDLPEIGELTLGYIEGPHYPVREGGLVEKGQLTEEQNTFNNHITKPKKETVIKPDPVTGEFDDLAAMNAGRPPMEDLITDKTPLPPMGIPIM